MGLFDGAVQGWNTLTKAAGDVQKNIEGGVNSVKKWATGESSTPALLQPNPIIKETVKAIENPPDVPKIITEDVPKAVDNWASGDTDLSPILQPNPIIKTVKKVIDEPKIITEDIPSKVNETWEKTTETVTNTVNNVTNTVTETVKETVGNVGKGLKDALPYVAIGGAALIAANLLLGRR